MAAPRSGSRRRAQTVSVETRLDPIPARRPDEPGAGSSLRGGPSSVTRSESDPPVVGPPGPLADRGAAPGACPDLPDRLARRPERRGPGHPAGRGPRRLPGPARGGGRRARRPALARARLGRRPRRRRPVGPLRPVAPARCVRRDAGASEAGGAGLSRAPARGPTSRGPPSAPHAEDEGPVYPGTCSGRSVGRRPRTWATARSPGGSGSRRADRLGRPRPRPRRARPEPARRRLHRRPDRGRPPVLSARRRARRRGHGRHPGDPGRRPGAEHPAAAPALPEPRLDPPEFGHVPLAVGPDGRRLAKRDGSIKLATLRDAGVDPRRLVGWLARSCGWADRIVPSSPRDWIGSFDLGSLPKAPWVVTPESLAELAA